MAGFETRPRISAVENIGPIASDWATAWIVERFFCPRLALGAVEPVSLIELLLPAGAPCAGDDAGIQGSNIECQPQLA